MAHRFTRSADDLPMLAAFVSPRNEHGLMRRSQYWPEPQASASVGQYGFNRTAPPAQTKFAAQTPQAKHAAHESRGEPRAIKSRGPKGPPEIPSRLPRRV